MIRNLGFSPIIASFAYIAKKESWLVRAFFAINWFILWMICADWQDRPAIIQAPKCSQSFSEALKIDKISKKIIFAFKYENTISIKLRVIAVIFQSNLSTQILTFGTYVSGKGNFPS